MIRRALQPGSGIDPSTLVFLRYKLHGTERRLQELRRDPPQAFALAALSASRAARLTDLRELREEVRAADEKAKKAKKKAKKDKKHKKDKKKTKDKKEKKDKKGKKDKEEKPGKEEKAEKKAGKWQTPSHLLPAAEPVRQALVTDSARRSQVVAPPAACPAGGPAPPSSSACPPLPPPLAPPPPAAPQAVPVRAPEAAAPAPTVAPAPAPAPALGQAPAPPSPVAPAAAPTARGRRQPRTDYEVAEAAAQGALEKDWVLDDFGSARSDVSAQKQTQLRRNRMEALCRLKLRAAALGAKLPPALEARWPQFVVWFEREKANAKGLGIAQYWLVHTVLRIDAATRQDAHYFVRWVTEQVGFMPAASTTARL